MSWVVREACATVAPIEESFTLQLVQSSRLSMEALNGAH